MNLVDYINKIRSTNGNSGDNSFEYLGITLYNGIKSTKLYLKPNESVMSLLKTMNPYNHILAKFSAFYHLDGIGICDISKSTYDEQQTYKIVFSLPRNLTIEKGETYVAHFFSIVKNPILKDEVVDMCLRFSSFVKSNVFLLQQIGVECDRDGNIICIKYYINIKNSRHQKTHWSELLYNNVAEAFMTKSVLQNKDMVLDKLNRICKHNYYPVFVGVNAFESFADYKLYMISGASGYDNDTLLNSAISLFAENNWNEYIVENQLSDIYKSNLFAKGIACTLNNPQEARIYFGRQPRTIF